MTASTGGAVLGRSHLRVVEAAFTALVAAPRRLTLDCTTVGGVPGPSVGLPTGVVELAWLRQWLLTHRSNYPARDAVWRELISRARTANGEWRIVAVAMAMPALVRIAAGLTRGYRGDPTDVDNEVLTGFLAALEHRLDLGGSRLSAKLCWAGYRAGYAARHAQSPAVLVGDIDSTFAAAPHLPYGHPDLLLARAVALGVIDADDADLITATWLEQHSIEAVATRTGADAGVLRMRRLRAGRRVAQAITDGSLSTVLSTEARAGLARRAEIRAAGRSGRSGAPPTVGLSQPDGRGADSALIAARGVRPR